jgi:hypothetical protein
VRREANAPIDSLLDEVEERVLAKADRRVDLPGGQRRLERVRLPAGEDERDDGAALAAAVEDADAVDLRQTLAEPGAERRRTVRDCVDADVERVPHGRRRAEERRVRELPVFEARCP